MLPRESFTRKQTLDVRLALASALAAHLRTLEFNSGGALFSFAQVFDEWPAWEQEFVSPAACVLPDEELAYVDARPVPTLLEETWEPQGQAGWGLYALSDAECDLRVNVRAPSGGERTAIVQTVEEAFVIDQVTGNYDQGRRYGIMLDLPEYFALQGRFSLQTMRILDDAETAMRNQNEAVFLVRAQAPHVKVAPVQPFLLRIEDLSIA